MIIRDIERAGMKERLAQRLLELVSIDSVTRDEQKIADWVEAELQGLPGYRMVRVENSLCYLSLQRKEKPVLALYGHLDTVKNQQDKKPYIEGDRLYGCGASDMKGGLAVMMELMNELSGLKSFPYHLDFIFYSKEEGPYDDNGLEPVLKDVKELQEAKLALVLEPTSNVIQVGCVGGLHAEVTFHGQSAHSARPWQGENAVFKALDLLKRLSELKRVETEFGGLKFYEVMHPTMIKAGTTRNSIPGEMFININYRFAPGKTIEEAKRELLVMIGEGAEVNLVDECPSGKVFLENTYLQRLKRVSGAEFESKQAWTDIARLGLYGIEAVNFGPGIPAQAHQKNEHIHLSDLVENFKIIKEFVLGE